MTMPRSDETATVLHFDKGMQLLRPASVVRATQVRRHNNMARSLSRSHAKPPEEPSIA